MTCFEILSEMEDLVILSRKGSISISHVDHRFRVGNDNELLIDVIGVGSGVDVTCVVFGGIGIGGGVVSGAFGIGGCGGA